MNRVKLLIRRDVFINWMFGEHEDKLRIADYMLQSLIKNGEFTITSEEILEECGFFPYTIVENKSDIDEDDMEDLEIDLEKYKVELT